MILVKKSLVVVFLASFLASCNTINGASQNTSTNNKTSLGTPGVYIGMSGGNS